jgi:hypothetical protein
MSKLDHGRSWLSLSWLNDEPDFVLTKIYQDFFVHILRACPTGVERGDWLELMFGQKTRYIEIARVKTGFQIPGLYAPCPEGRRIPGYLGNRKVKKDMHVFIRFDETRPNRIDFEAPINPGGREKIFQLTPEQFEKIKANLEILECQKRYVS